MPGEYETHPKGAPGSPEAYANGCKCPILDNAHGKGIGGGHYWISEKCPIHANGKDTLPIYNPEP